jgi:hypothetical protein
MLITELKKKNYISKLFEGGNVRIGQHEAETINLLVHKRDFILPVLNQLLLGINSAYQKIYKAPLWNPALLQNREFLSGSSLHFFDTNINDEQFTKLKPKVGDIDTQVDINQRDTLADFLQKAKGKKVGNAIFLGYEVGNEQFSSLWQFDTPPIKIQIDFEFVEFKGGTPTPWARFSHSSAWQDIQQGVKGVFHKYAVQSLTSLTKRDFLLRKMVGRGKLKKEEDVPTNDNMFSFAVSSKEGGGLRSKYEPVIDPTTMKPVVVKGLPVMKALPAAGYEQDLDKMLQTLLGNRIKPNQIKNVSQKFWSFTGILEIMNVFLKPEEKNAILEDFINRCFGSGVQGLYKNDPERDSQEKLTAVNLMSKAIGVPLPKNFKQTIDSYKSTYRMVKEAGEVVQSKRKGIVHLEKMKDTDFLDLLDELHDKGKFKLQNIPMTVKVDGFGGRIGKSEDGRPFFETSRSGPKFGSGQFLKYHTEKGTVDPEILGRAKLFDDLQNHMMNVIEGIDQKFGKDFLKNVKIHLEILYAPFGTQTEDGRIKYVGIAYDKLPKGINLALVPLFAENSATGEEHTQSDKIVQAVKNIKKIGNTMFIDNSLTQNDSLDLTAIVPPLENIEIFRSMIESRKRDQAAEVKATLEPIKKAVADTIINDPNILGKDVLGRDYEGIILNTKKGPVKITSTQQRDVIAKKQAAIKQVQQSQQAAKNIPNTSNRTAVVAIGSFVGHRGHQQLFKYTIDRAKSLGGDPYLFMGNAVGKNDPIPVPVKVKTWHMLYPNYASHISAVTQEGGTLMQKIKHELIQPQPNTPPRYDNIIIMVGEDQANMPIAQALMKSVNKFKGYEHVKASLEATPRGTGISFTQLRNILKDSSANPKEQLAFWSRAFDGKEFGAQPLPTQWIEYLMQTTRQGMGIQEPMSKQQQVKEFIQRVRPLIKEANAAQKIKVLSLLKESLSEYRKVEAPVKEKTCNYCKKPEEKCMCSQHESIQEVDNDVDLTKRHPMDWGKKTYMIRQISKVTGWDVSDLSLASDEEIQDLYNEHVKTEIDESLVLNPTDLIDVYLKGKHNKQDITKLVASRIPNKSLDKLTQLLVTKYKVNPNAIIYGPSKDLEENLDYLDEV